MSKVIGRGKYKGKWVEGQYFYNEPTPDYEISEVGYERPEQHIIRVKTPNSKIQITDYVLPKNKIQIKNEQGKFVKLL